MPAGLEYEAPDGGRAPPYYLTITTHLHHGVSYGWLQYSYFKI